MSFVLHTTAVPPLVRLSPFLDRLSAADLSCFEVLFPTTPVAFGSAASRLWFCRRLFVLVWVCCVGGGSGFACSVLGRVSVVVF